MLPFHPYADLFPLIEGAEFAELVADVKANDLREKIVVWDGKILDGRNRYRAALAAGLLDDDDEPDRAKYFVRFVPSVDGNPLDFVISKNVHRRHLTTGQRAYAMAEYETFRHGGAREQDANLQVAPASTRADLAAKGHVSERSIASAAVVRDRGVPELKTAVRQGGIAISAAEGIARLPEQEQPAAVERALPNGARALMASRQEPSDSLDYFPTPPWATRALIERVLFDHWNISRAALRHVWEPACGEGHIAEVLAEYFPCVTSSDIFDGYDYGPLIEHDFLSENSGDLCRGVDWIVTNPPFGDKAEGFVLRALEYARVGVAMFVRLQWLETNGRYERIFKPHPPALIAQFAERVPLCKGRWNPDGDTATAYLWLVWLKAERGGRTEFMWIPPGQRDALTHADDRERFTAHPVIKRTAQIPAVEESGLRLHATEAESKPESPSIDIPTFLRRGHPDCVVKT